MISFERQRVNSVNLSGQEGGSSPALVNFEYLFLARAARLSCKETKHTAWLVNAPHDGNQDPDGLFDPCGVFIRLIERASHKA